MNRKNASFSFWGVVIFFFTIAFAVTTAIFFAGYAYEKSGGNKLHATAVVFLVTVFFSVLYSIADIIRRRIMIDKPTEDILSATEKIARGDFTVRLTPRGKQKDDPYDCIMENVNALAAELSKSEILKTDFISAVSHEIKTPLSVLQNYAALLHTDGLTDEERKAYAKTLETAAKRLTLLVTDILRLNKLENRALPPEKKSFRLDEQLAEAAVSFEALLDKKELALEVDMDELTIVSDPALLELVWNNLLSNAVKFTNEGKITLTLHREGKNAVVRISDTGMGISPETGMRIFDKFYQGDTSRAAEGNGLGLALVKRVIDILGGEISVESELNKGSVFTVKLILV